MPAGVGPMAEGEVLDLTATQAMGLGPLPGNLRRNPHGDDLHDLTEAEKRWVMEERQVREWALDHPD
eukprot:7303197-Alexandrium_andersonii.AAC.1